MATKKEYKWSYVINDDLCMTCATCELECSDDAIYIEDYAYFRIDDEKCTRCNRCYRACPVEAIARVPISQAS